MSRSRVHLFLLLTVLGCDTPVDVPVSTELSRVPEGLRLEVSVDRAVITSGDTANIQVSLTNTRSEPVTLHFGSTCQLVFEVENAAGQRVYPVGGWGCGMALTELSIKSGETRKMEAKWVTGGSPNPDEGRDPFPSGQYQVYGVLGAQPKLRSGSAPLAILPPAS